MRTNARPNTLTIMATADMIPQGVYPGECSGYVVDFQIGHVKYRTSTLDGIRGRTACSVTVNRRNEITVESVNG